MGISDFQNTHTIIAHGKLGVVLEKVLNATGRRASYKKNRMGYGAWVGCDSELHACGDHHTIIIML